MNPNPLQTQAFGQRNAATLFCLALGTMFLHMAWTEEFSIPLTFFICALGGIWISTSLLVTAPADRGFIVRIFILSYSLNVLFAFALYYYYVGDHHTPFLTTELNPHDDEHFYRIGTAIAKDWMNGTSRSQIMLKEYTYKGYPWLLGAIYFLAGQVGDLSVLAPRIVNAMCGGLLTVTVFSLANLAYNASVGVRAAIFAAFFPTFWFYSGNTLRDIIIALLIAISALIILKLQRRAISPFSLTLWIGFPLCLFFTFLLRSSTFFALLGAVGFYFAVCLKGTVLRVLAVGLAAVLLLGAILYGKEFGAPPPDSLLKQSDHYTENIVTGASKESLAIRYIYKAPRYLFLPLNATYTAFAPIPPVKSLYLPHIIDGIGAVIWYFYIPFWIIGMYYGLRNRQSLLLVIVTIILFLGIATIVASSRHKIQFQALALVHAAEASFRLSGLIVPITFLVALALCLLGALYLLLKF